MGRPGSELGPMKPDSDKTVSFLDELVKSREPAVRLRKMGAGAVRYANMNDNAMQTVTNGGINLDPAMVSFHVQRDGHGFALPAMSALSTDRDADFDGLEPFIIQVSPGSAMPSFIGLGKETFH
jgi:hypothetical protein